MSRLSRHALALASFVLATQSALAAPAFDQGRKELEAVLEQMIEHLPGSWDSFPQIFYERTQDMPSEGEHDHWHRTFAYITAPQVGEHVFYGQINVNGRHGPILGRSQVLYKAMIDETRGVVSITGQSVADPDNFENLHERPDLWTKVRMVDEAQVKCDFIWRQHGEQLVGVLDGKTPERRKHGPGTCSYISERNDGEEFIADAEWVLGRDELWLYDINSLGGRQFIGREDKTHLRLYRARPYKCVVNAGGGSRTVVGHDRGFKVESIDGAGADIMLLRAPYPAAKGRGLDDRLRLLFLKPGTVEILVQADAPPQSPKIQASHGNLSVLCTAEAFFP